MPKVRKRKPPAFLQWASAVAAVGSLLAAIASCQNSRSANATLHLEEQASLNLSCATHETKPGEPYPNDPYRMELVGEMHIPNLYGPIPVHDQSEHREVLPFMYSDCSLTNYGRLPAQNITFGVTARFAALGSRSATFEPQTIRVDGLVSGESHHFQIIDDTTLSMIIAFDRTAEFTDVEGAMHRVPLIVDDSVLDVERMIILGQPKALVIPTASPTANPHSIGQRP